MKYNQAIGFVPLLDNDEDEEEEDIFELLRVIEQLDEVEYNKEDMQ